MTLDDFQDLLDTYGANPDLWPDNKRELALLLIEQDENAVAMFDEAMMMDTVLAGDPAPAPSPTAMTSLFEDVARHADAEANRVADPVISVPEKQPTFVERMQDMILRPVTVMGASAAAGVVLGIWDSWLQPVVSNFQIAEFVYSALPL